MFRLLLLALFMCQFSFSQNTKTATYKYGHNGMQLIVTKSNETIIISTFNSKATIKEDIAQKLYDQYRSTTLCTGDILTILGKEAKVIGTCEIKQKGTLISVNFYYQIIEWYSGLTEFYKKT